MRLDPWASAAGVRLISHELLPSTHIEALALARNGERGPSWVSAAGNLFASLLLTDPAPPEHWPELAFVAALAAHDAVAEIVPNLKPQLAIKWPNDLLLNNAKFGGILIEGESAEIGAVAVGI